MRFFALALWAGAISAQPVAPELQLDPITRFQFAPVPEIVFVRGVSERMQLGSFVLAPDNRWTPGDFDRISDWHSPKVTQLIDIHTEIPVVGLTYDGATGELTYGGTWSGEAMVRLQAKDRSAESNTFRIRVLTPTVVFGQNASQMATANGWTGAVICEQISFNGCRALFKGGASDAAPLVILITPGTYENQNWYLGERRFAYVLGHPANRPLLIGDEIFNSRFEHFHVRNLRQQRSRIVQGAIRTDVPQRMIVSNVSQCCEDKDYNGIVNPTTATRAPVTISIWQFESIGMGSPGNGQHGLYLEGRPHSTLDINNSRFFGSRGSSSVKTTMQNVSIRHSKFCVTQDCSTPPVEPNGQKLTHTPVDIPAVSNITIYGNEFQVYRRTTVGAPSGESGVLAGTIYIRLRQKGLKGSDIPAYPDISWDPPRTTRTVWLSPGKGWSGGPETYVDPLFWADVRSKPITDPFNELTFKHYLSYNTFIQLPGSRSVFAMRDDGTHAAEATSQFGYSRMLRVPEQWLERSVAFLAGNTYVGYGETQQKLQLKDSAFVVDIEEGAQWPRKFDEDFPHALEVEGLPEWFKL